MRQDFERIEELTQERIIERKNKRRNNLLMHILVCSALIIILITAAVVTLTSLATENTGDTEDEVFTSKYVVNPPEYREQFLPVNPYSRPGDALEEVKGIVIHYTGNPGTTAQQNYAYFAGLAETGETSASSHFIVGLSGEIIQCVPLNEIAYATKQRNQDTISIECCIDNEEGRFNEKTYDALVELTAWLVGKYELTGQDIIRHYDVTGKICPKYFVEHPSAWEDFKLDVKVFVEEKGVYLEEYLKGITETTEYKN